MTVSYSDDVAVAVSAAVAAVADPEMSGVSIGALGLVRSISVGADGHAEIDLVPTFLGCPALDVIRADVAFAARRAGASDVTVRFDVSVPWSTGRISTEGRGQLAALGIAVRTDAGLRCPHCGDVGLRTALRVGPASCRSTAWCGACRSVVDVMRDHERIELADTADNVDCSVTDGGPEKGSYAHV